MLTRDIEHRAKFVVARQDGLLLLRAGNSGPGGRLVEIEIAVFPSRQGWYAGWRYIRSWFHGRGVTGFYGRTLLCPAWALCVGPLVPPHVKGMVSPLHEQRIREAEHRDMDSLKVVLTRVAQSAKAWKAERA